MASFLLISLITLFVFICLILILIVLVQKGRGGGLASAFGGAGGNTAFGSKTGDVLTWVTSVIFGIFLLLAVGLNLMADSLNRPAETAEAETAPLPVQQAPTTTATIPAELPVEQSSPDTAPAPAPLPATQQAQ